MLEAVAVKVARGERVVQLILLFPEGREEEAHEALQMEM